MKKLLVVNDLLVGGGVEKLMIDFIKHWSKTYKVTLMTNSCNRASVEDLPSNVKLIKYGPMNIMMWKKGLRKFGHFLTHIYNSWVTKRINLSGYDIIISMKEGDTAELVSRLHAKAKFCWVHVDYEAHYWTKNIFPHSGEERQCFQRYDYVVCVSSQVKSSIINVIGDPGNLIVLDNPIDVERIRTLAMIEDGTVWKKKKETLFVAIGRLHCQKGFKRLVDVCARLEKDYDDFEVWIIGTGREEEELLAYTKEKKVNTIHFLGYQTNPYQYLKEASWFISTSRYEGYSLVSQEAAVLGIPIIATNCAGVGELIGENGEYGIIAQQTVESIYESMKRVLDQKALRSYYQDKIIQRSRDIDFQDRMTKIDGLLDEVSDRVEI